MDYFLSFNDGIVQFTFPVVRTIPEGVVVMFINTTHHLTNKQNTITVLNEY